MSNIFAAQYEQWRLHPRRYDLPFLIGAQWRRYRARSLAGKQRRELLVPPIDTVCVEILASPEFRASCAAVSGYTLLDVARLANLWQLARLAGEGCFLEVGSYRGGGALHICNAVRDRSPRFYCFDPFEDGGFENIGPEDRLFRRDQFRDTSYEAAKKLLSGHPAAAAVKGFFPASAEELNLRNIAFCHLDVDVYEATRDGLEFLAGRLAPRSLIVLDDLNRGAGGVNLAAQEFLRAHPDFMLIPLFPSQGVLFCPRLWV